jgi:hypothetical protein
MRAASKRNFSSAKYGKFIWAYRKGVDLSQGPPKRKGDVVQIPAVIETPLVPTENAPSSSGWHSNVVLLLDLIMSFSLHSFVLDFPELHVAV